MDEPCCDRQSHCVDTTSLAPRQRTPAVRAKDEERTEKPRNQFVDGFSHPRLSVQSGTCAAAARPTLPEAAKSVSQGPGTLVKIHYQ